MIDAKGIIHIWNWSKGKELQKFAAPNAAGKWPAWGSRRAAREAFAASSDGNTLMFLNRTNSLRVVDVRTGTEVGPGGHTLQIQSVQFTPDGKQLITQSLTTA